VVKYGQHGLSRMQQVVIIVEGGYKYTMDPVVISSRSKYFRATLDSGMWNEAKEGVIQLPMIDNFYFSLIIFFLYSGVLHAGFSEINNNAKQSDKQDIILSVEQLVHLIHWSKYFEIPSLSSAAQRYITKFHLLPHTACAIWNLASSNHFKHLGSLCREYVENNFESVVQYRNEFLSLKKSLLKSVLSSGAIHMGTNELLSYIEEWIRANSLGLESVNQLRAQLLPPATFFNLSNRCAILSIRSLNSFPFL